MKKTDFENLVIWKEKLRKYPIILKDLEKELYVLEPKSKKYKVIETKIKEHKQTFIVIEKKILKYEAKFFDIERGLYKGVAIDVQDKKKKKIPLYLKLSNLSNHVGYTGTTRVGKTKNMINDARQLAKAGWDVIIVDPKGGEDQEILNETVEASFQANRAEDFRYISPAFSDESEQMNLLFGMGDEEIASLIKNFAESVSGDGFFSEVVFQNTQAAVKGLSFVELATDPFGEYTQYLEEQELKRYLNLKMTKGLLHDVEINRWNKTKTPDDLFLLMQDENKNYKFLDSEIEIEFYQNRSMVTLKTLSKFVSFESLDNLRTLIKDSIPVPSIEIVGERKYNDIIRLKNEALLSLDLVLSEDNSILMKEEDRQKTKERLKENFVKISKSHSVLLSQLTFGDIGKVFSNVGINPLANRLLSEENGLIAVMQPFPMKYKTISNMSVMAILKSIESMMGLVGSSGRANKRRLAIMIDEAGSIMYNQIEDLFNKAGGLGVSMFVYTQSYEDYALKLGETCANVIRDNINTPIVMRMNHSKSAKEAAESVGTTLIYKNKFMAGSDTNVISSADRYSIDSVREAIATFEEINSLPIGMGFIRHDMKTYLVDFTYVPSLKNYPIEMPVLDTEKKVRHIAKYEDEILKSIAEVQNISLGVKVA